MQAYWFFFSGGHINPAVTMVMVLLGRTTWSMLLVYWLAQYLGGIVGAGIVYGVYSGNVAKQAACAKYDE